MAEPAKYAIVKFKKLPIAEIKPLWCVPASWIKCQMDDENVAVAFPPVLNSNYRSRMKTGKEPILKWKQFPATVKERRDEYEEPNIEAAGAAGGSPGGPETPRPKKREARINSANVETQTTLNQTVEVQQLDELYRKLEEMRSMMEKLFPTNYGNNPNEYETLLNHKFD